MEEKENRVYLIIAYRFSNQESHSYPVSICFDKESAIKIAEEEANNRGGKYDCWVYYCIPEKYLSNEDIIYKTGCWCHESWKKD